MGRRTRRADRVAEVDSGRPARARAALADERSGRVVFASHCLLNQNTRYPGGACCSGAVMDFVEPFLHDGVGICQMPCPEQAVWGGVGKRHVVRFWGRPRARWLAKRGLGAFLGYTRVRYRRLARHVAEEIADYQANGIEIVGIVGVGASPSCGVVTTVDVAAALGPLVACPLDQLNRGFVNDAIAAAARSGRGIFFDELVRALRRQGIDVPFLEHDLSSEWPANLDSPGAQPVSLTRDRLPE